MQRMIVSTLACSMIASLTGCALDPAPEPGEPEDLGAHTSAIIGVATPPIAGSARIRVTGQLDVHTGILIGNAAGSTLVLTSERWMSWQTVPNTVGVAVPGPGGTFLTRPGRFINDSAWFPGAILQVSAVSSNQFPLDNTAPNALLGRLARCYEYTSDTTMAYADIRFVDAVGDDLYYVPVTGQLSDADAGAPCILDGAAFVGFVRTGNASGGIVQHAGSMKPWIDGMVNLAATRDDSRSSLVAIHTKPNGLASPDRMCLDIPWGSPYQNTGVNQFRCHNAPNQRFWLDYRVDPSNPRLVNDADGMCIDVPSNSTTSGTNLQVFPCHSGLNQQFVMDVWPSGGLRFRPRHIGALSQCMSVEGGPSTTSLPVEQRTCAAAPAANSDQKWYLQFNPPYTP